MKHASTVSATGLVMALFGWGACAAHSHAISIDSHRDPAEAWPKECLIHRPCQDIKAPPRCPRDMKLSTFPVTPAPSEDSDPTLSIAGRLTLPEDRGQTVAACPCCNEASRWAALIGDNGFASRLPNIGCFGDDSRLCCNVSATGQRVVATGKVRLLGQGAEQRGYFVGEVTLCTP